MHQLFATRGCSSRDLLVILHVYRIYSDTGALTLTINIYLHGHLELPPHPGEFFILIRSFRIISNFHTKFADL